MQLLVAPWQYDALRLRAKREGRSLSAVLRDILTEHLTPKRGREVLGVPDLGRRHDQHRYGAPEEPEV